MKSITLFRNCTALLITLTTFLQLFVAGASALSQPFGYEVGELGASGRTWFKVVAQTNSAGLVSLATNVAFVELNGGMHYRDASGNWLESEESIESFPGGAVARHGPCKLFSVNWLSIKLRAGFGIPC